MYQREGKPSRHFVLSMTDSQICGWGRVDREEAPNTEICESENKPLQSKTYRSAKILGTSTIGLKHQHIQRPFKLSGQSRLGGSSEK